jgi:hypothetical protein
LGFTHDFPRLTPFSTRWTTNVVVAAAESVYRIVVPVVRAMLAPPGAAGKAAGASFRPARPGIAWIGSGYGVGAETVTAFDAFAVSPLSSVTVAWTV